VKVFRAFSMYLCINYGVASLKLGSLDWFNSLFDYPPEPLLAFPCALELGLGFL
jgi:hypothetical protein